MAIPEWAKKYHWIHYPWHQIGGLIKNKPAGTFLFFTGMRDDGTLKQIIGSDPWNRRYYPFVVYEDGKTTKWAIVEDENYLGIATSAGKVVGYGLIQMSVTDVNCGGAKDLETFAVLMKKYGLSFDTGKGMVQPPPNEMADPVARKNWEEARKWLVEGRWQKAKRHTGRCSVWRFLGPSTWRTSVAS
jgi:hypothetical protein